jgi:hypothetical protein
MHGAKMHDGANISSRFVMANDAAAHRRIARVGMLLQCLARVPPMIASISFPSRLSIKISYY